MHHANTIKSQLLLGKLHQRKIPVHGLVSKNKELYLSFNKSLAAYQKYDEDSNKNPKHARSFLSNTGERNINNHRIFAEHFSLIKNSNQKSTYLLWLDKLASANCNQIIGKGRRLYLVKLQKLSREKNPWHFVSQIKANKIFPDGKDNRQKTSKSAIAQGKPELLNDRHYHLDNLSSPQENLTRGE